MLDIEIVTPEMAQAWIDGGVHRRYDRKMREVFSNKEAHLSLCNKGTRLYVLEHGQRLTAPVIFTDTNEVYDGALALHALVCYGEPVECAILRTSNLSTYVKDRMATSRLPRLWGWEHVPNEHRPLYARTPKETEDGKEKEIR